MRIRCLYVFHFCNTKHVTRMSQTPNRLNRQNCEIAIPHTAAASTVLKMFESHELSCVLH